MTKTRLSPVELAGLCFLVFTFPVTGSSAGAPASDAAITEGSPETHGSLPVPVRTARQPVLFLSEDYTIVDTGQHTCYDDVGEIDCPGEGEPFHGQDAQYQGTQPSYRDNGDGTITDASTSLMWQKSPGSVKSTFVEAMAAADTFSLAGYDDWRLPTIKELYSLIDFKGSSTAMPPVPYIDTTYFDFAWGDTTAGERLIDAQYCSGNEYVGTVFDGEAAVFGVNFADGRIKGYPRDTGPGGTMTFYVRYVRGTTNYGINDFIDNGDGTITDRATGLMWTKADSDTSLNWQGALEYAENLVFAGYDDWRLPNVKELQSIVDYTRAPDAQNPSQAGPAIDPIFDITNIGSDENPDYGFFWAGTTHLDGLIPDFATYICFGIAWGYMGPPGQEEWMNVHGAGAQRSDPKNGDPGDWPYGNGPQGDEVRIFNYVRCVRGGVPTVIEDDQQGAHIPKTSELYQNSPNPFNPRTTITYRISVPGRVRLDIYDLLGRRVRQLAHAHRDAGTYTVTWDGRSEAGNEVGSGIYFLKLQTAGEKTVRKMLLAR